MEGLLIQRNSCLDCWCCSRWLTYPMQHCSTKCSIGPVSNALWVFRKAARYLTLRPFGCGVNDCKKQDLIGDLSEATGRQLARAGFIARGGQIIDASIVTAPIQRHSRAENQAIGRDEVPTDWNKAKRAQKDVQARWTKKHNQSDYGYKRHANTDRRWGFIRKMQVTSAQVSDSTVFESIPDNTNTSRAVYADRGLSQAGTRDLNYENMAIETISSAKATLISASAKPKSAATSVLPSNVPLVNIPLSG